MPRPRTFTELLLFRTAELADRTAYVFLRRTREGLESRPLSYGRLDRAARGIAAWIQANGCAGERVMLLQSSKQAFVESFVGCLYAGAVAVPVPPQDGGAHHAERAMAIARDADVRLVLTDAEHEPEVARLLADAGTAHIRCLATDLLADQDAANWRMPERRPDELAFLQYTSGSTSEPKGVMVAHDNLMANQAAISRAMGTGADSVIGGWLPLHHDMGLVGHLLHPLWLGAHAVLMSPSSFVRRPVSWLQMISDHRVTTGGGPNFGYELCLDRVSDEQMTGLDLSSWRTAVNGAEPVRAETLRRFADRFARVGLRRTALYPSYGMAEATLLVAGGTPGRAAAELTVDAAALARHQLLPATGAGTRTLVSSGRARDFDLRIVDPDTGEVLDDGAIGEIWLRGPSVARGYWNRPRENARAFHATTADGDTGYLRTGDTGVLRDGELYVTGRLKEIVIMSGRNLYPHDIERAVQRTSSRFGVGAAFGVDTGREHVVLVQEVRRARESDPGLGALAALAQQCIVREFEVPADNVVLVRPGTVARTTSGKVRRGEMRRLLLGGGLEPVHQVLHPRVRELIDKGAEPSPVLAVALPDGRGEQHRAEG